MAIRKCRVCCGLRLAPGQVAIVTAVEPVAYLDASAYRFGTFHSSGTVAPSGLPQRAEPTGPRPLWNDNAQGASGPASLATQEASDTAGQSVEGTAYDMSPETEQSLSRDPRASFTFEVYVLDYVAEVITVRLNVPCGLSSALQGLSSARDPVSRARFPRLFPASHQSATANGLVLAVPAWESSSIVVLVENGFAGNRLFAAAAPPRATNSFCLGF